MEFHFLFNSKAPGERARLLAVFEEFVRENKIPKAISGPADLALEEHLTNILNYGFSDQDEHIISIRCSFEAAVLEIEVTDDGRPFDSSKHPAPDLTIPALQRPIGGLGIHMIRQSMDSLEYKRLGDRNVLKMWKALKG